MTNKDKFVRINNCHVDKEVFYMYNEQQAILACSEEPSLIFTFIKKGYYDIVEQLVNLGKIPVNLCDSVGNNVVMRLLKAKQYDLVLKLMKKRNWDVNHQNEDGDTFGHILAQDNSVSALKIVEQLMKKKKYIPNIKNHKGQTVLDLAINNNYIYTAFKFLEDKRFNNIDVLSFKNLYTVCIKNTYYGIYSKLNNLEVIVDSLKKKDLVPSMECLIERIDDNMDAIKGEIMRNNSSLLEEMINYSLEPSVE